MNNASSGRIWFAGLMSGDTQYLDVSGKDSGKLGVECIKTDSLPWSAVYCWTLIAVGERVEGLVGVTAAAGRGSLADARPKSARRFLPKWLNRSLPEGLSRSYLLLVAGSSVSMLGTRVSTIAYPMLVLYLTKSPVVAGWAAFAATAPRVLAYIPAGALVDRWDTRKSMLVSEFGRGCAVCAVVIALVISRTGPWLVGLLIGMAVLEETLEVFTELSERRLITGLLGRRDASSVMGGNEARRQLMVLVGRPAGGLLFTFKIAGIQHILPFLADLISFICSIGSLIGVKYERGSDAVRGNELSREYSARGILEGLHWMLRNPYARAACFVNAGATLVAQALILIFLAEADQRKLSYFTIGIVLASTGAGGALGSLAAKRLRQWYGDQWFQVQMWVWLIVFAGIVITIPNHHSLRYLFAEMFLLGLSGAIGNVEIEKYLVERSPADLLARVDSVNSLVDFCACATGPVLGGLLVQVVMPQKAIYGLMFIVLILVVCSLWMPSGQQSGSGQFIGDAPDIDQTPDDQPGSEQVQREPHLAPAHS